MKSIHIAAETLPEAFEKALVECWNHGDEIKTQYDRSDDLPSKDCTMMICVADPLKEPKFSRILPMGLDDLEKYFLEVTEGVHDYYMDDVTNPNRWHYTYYSRLFKYKVPCNCFSVAGDQLCPRCGSKFYIEINQIAKCIEMLKQCGHTRRAQAITWCPWIDMDIADPPCLQSLSFRVQNYSGAFKLNMIVRFRSNDLYKAYPSNAIALVGIQEIVAKAIGLPVGSYTHISDSMHLYGSYFKEIEGCLNTIKHRRFEDRVWTTKECVPFFIEGCNQLLNETNMPNDKKNLVVARRTYLENNFL